MLKTKSLRNPAKQLLKLSARRAGSATDKYRIVDHTFDAVVVGAGFTKRWKTLRFSIFLGGAGLRAAMGLSEGGMKTGFNLHSFAKNQTYICSGGHKTVPNPIAHCRCARWHKCCAREHEPRRLALALL